MIKSSLFALVFASAGMAFAGTAKDHRSEDLTGKVTAPGLEEHADYFSESRKNVSKEDLLKADVLRVKTINSIIALLEDKSKKKKTAEFELTLRLGELYVERHDYIRDIELEEYTEAFNTWQKQDEKTRGPEPRLTYKRSEDQLHNAVNAFRRLVNKFPKHPRTDAALYALAKSMARLNDDGAINYYKQLVRNHPNSPLIPDAYLAMGEFYFDKHQIPEAVESYQKVIKFKDHRAYPYAVYKLGWAFYNTDPSRNKYEGENYKKAIAAFKLVVVLSGEKKLKSNFDLREEAIKDLIMVWAEAEDIDSAWKYFQTIGEKDRFYTMLERLGNIYVEQGQNEKAIQVFSRLLDESPLRPNNPEIYAKVLQLHDLTNNFQAVVADMRAMADLYLTNKEWYKANAVKPQTYQDAYQTIERTIHRYSTLIHDRGQKAKNNALLALAAKGYQIYLEKFPKSSSSYELRYYLAEIQFDLKQYEAASQNYMVVATTKTKNDKYMKPAALSAVSAIAKMNETSKFAELPPAGQVPKPIEIPRTKKLYIDVIDQYVSILPKEKDGNAMRYTAAQIYFDYGHYPDALKRYDQIVKDIPGTKQSFAAAKLILGYYGDKENWDLVIKYGKDYQQNKTLMANEDLKKYTLNILKHAVFSSALAYEKSKEFEKAAKGFIEFKKMFPADANADRSLYNASLCYFRISRLEDSLATSKMILDEYPHSKLAPDVVATMSETYEALAQFENAGKNYKRLAIMFPNDKRAPTALFNSGVLFKGIKKTDLAIDSFQEMIKRYPDNSLALESRYQIAALQEKTGNLNGALSSYEAYVKASPEKNDQVMLASAKVADLKFNTGKPDQGRADAMRLGQALQKKNAPTALEARRLTASILFKMQEGNYKAFKSMPLNDGAQIEKLVQKKQQKLVALASAYETIMNIGDGEHIVASLYRLGEMHEDFAKALFAATPPQGANQAETNKFKSSLEQVAFPLREEAYKFYETAFKRSQEIETFTAWTQKTYDKMVELMPEKHPEIVEQSVKPAYFTNKISINETTAELAH